MKIFSAHGSAEDEALELEGNEMRRAIWLIPNKCLFFVCMISAIVGGCAVIVMNIFMGDMMTSLLGGGDVEAMMSDPDGASGWVQKQVNTMALRMFYVVMAMMVIQCFCYGLRAHIGSGYVLSIRCKILEIIFEQDIDYFDAMSTGVLIGRMSQDVTLLKEQAVDKLIDSITNGSQAIAGFILAFVYSWKVGLVAFSGVPICGAIFMIGDCCVERMWKTYNDTTSAAAANAEEVITSFRTVKAFDNELASADKYVSGLWSVYDVLKKTSVIKGSQNGVMMFFVWGLCGLITFYCGYLVLYENVESGTIVVVMTGMLMGSLAGSQAFSSVSGFKKARYSAFKILQLLHKKPKINRRDGNSLGSVSGKVEFRDVKFKYSTRDEYAVNGLSFTINAGETVALVGESGCGKSTTLALLERFYELESGQILIDDVDISTIAPQNIRKHVAIVPQGPVLFSMSVRDNIRFGKPDADNDTVENAGRVGNAHNFVVDLPTGYDTIVQQTSLSGGQKQRLCIARAILSDVPILLLDEATAALDAESEQLVQNSLEQVRHGKTAILVAHRLSTVRNADRILVFKEGQIVETGTHDELLMQDGIYSELVKHQLQ